jgi:hypothetical protein
MGGQKANGSDDSSSGLVQLPFLDMKEPMLSQDETDESEKPDDEVGLLDVSL